MLVCTLHRAGHPSHCAVRAESPAGYGFGSAAVAMSRVFLVRPVTRNGQRFDLPVIIPVNFIYVPAALSR